MTPIVTPGNEGFTFTAFWSAVNIMGGAANEKREDSTIFFTVTDLAGAFLHDLGLGFNGAVTGDGATHVTEQYCLNGDPMNCNNLQVTNPPPSFSQNIVLASNVTSLSISKDIGVDSGTNGTASISNVTNQFSNVPEPRLVSLLTLALLGGFGLSKRFKKIIA